VCFNYKTIRPVQKDPASPPIQCWPHATRLCSITYLNRMTRLVRPSCPKTLTPSWLPTPVLPKRDKDQTGMSAQREPGLQHLCMSVDALARRRMERPHATSPAAAPSYPQPWDCSDDTRASPSQMYLERRRCAPRSLLPSSY
jgi:hypothetical protein